MAKPIVQAPPADPIDIDPGEEYEYVIPAQGETGIVVPPDPAFIISLSGRTVTLKFAGMQASAAQIFTFEIRIANADGSVTHKPRFRVPGYGYSFSPTVDVWDKGAGHAPDIYYRRRNEGTTSADVDLGGAPPGGTLAASPWIYINGKIRFDEGDGSWPAVEGETLFVKSVGQQTFQVSTTAGGGAIAAAGAAQTFKATLALAVNGDTKILVWDSGKFKAGQIFQIKFSNGDDPAASNLAGNLYVKSIVDAAHITVSATLGGAAIAANADSFPADSQTAIVFNFSGRSFAAIESAAQTAVAANAPVAYQITTDLDPDVDSFFALGLPDGLAINNDTGEITGTPTQAGFFPIILVAEVAQSLSYRYWLLTVGGVSGTSEVTKPDAIYDLHTRRIYDLDGARADRIDIVLGDAPMLIGFESDRDAAKIPKGATLSFGLKKITDNSLSGWQFNAATWLVFGTIDLTNDVAQVSLNEDWYADALTALFTNERYIDFFGQFFLLLEGETRDRASYPFIVRVYNRANRDTVPPSAPITGSPQYYWSEITRLTGGVPATDLDARDLTLIPVNSLIKVKLAGFGISESAVEIDASTPGTDLNAGRIQPTNYNAVTNPKVLTKQSGDWV